MFSGDVYIIGGGMSLAGFDWHLLSGKQVIAVNNAYRKYPAAQVMFFGDRRFYINNKDIEQSGDFWRYNGQIYTSLSGFDGHPRIKHIDLGKPDWNSGLQAILLGFELGASRVILLGFDGTNGRWSDLEHYKHQGSVDSAAYTTYIDHAAELSHMPIINTNMSSAYQCFGFESLDSILKS